MIREIKDDCELEECLKVIRNSFITVAKDFNLTQENCPTNPAFITLEKLVEMKNRGDRMFGLFYENTQVGFVDIERSSDKIYYMKRLAVLPEYRHRGFGNKLVDFVFDYVKKQNGEKVCIGIINENTILKNWYKNHGFVEINIQKFEHLPFQVCFMEKKV